MQLKFESVDDVCCAVCLEVMYMPVGLKCGHLFCMSCIKQAVGVESSKPLGRAPRQASCPSCRQRGVFAGAVELYERAAASGSVPALNGLGFAYFNGHHLPQV